MGYVSMAMAKDQRGLNPRLGIRNVRYKIYDEKGVRFMFSGGDQLISSEKKMEAFKVLPT